jgi:hypothetical protein
MSGEHPCRDVTLSQVCRIANMAKDKGKRRLTQSRSVAGFKPFTLERRTDDNLPQHIKGAAIWREIEDEEGYWVFDILSTAYLAVEYKEATGQWYFI